MSVFRAPETLDGRGNTKHVVAALTALVALAGLGIALSGLV